MFFEDEKDIIRENADIRIDEDGTVTWEDVLNNEDDLKPASTYGKQVQPKQNAVNIGDELQLVEEEDSDVDDQELMNILNNAQASSVNENSKRKSVSSEEDFDIDSQLASVVLDQDPSEDIPLPRKEEKKQSSSLIPLLMFILLVAAIGGGVYYGIDYFKDSSIFEQVTQSELAPKPSVQEELNNTTQEDIEQRQVAQENIPVVNEEEADKVKPEEEKKEEKKQIIKVIPTGRSHPFMPIAKYAKTDIPDASILYDQAGIPKPPETFGVQEEETMQLMTIAVSGIMYDEVKPSAIITYDNNDYFVQKGDKLDNYKIIDISKNHVTIALGNNTYRANIGEEFKISTKFEGSAQFIPKSEGGGKQYYTTSGTKQTVSGDKNVRYVSEDDITINTK